MNKSTIWKGAVTLLFALFLSACGGSSSGGGTAAINTYTIGGSVNGLEGSGLVLQNNGGDDLAISGNSSFTFATALDDGSAYSVSVLTQPNAPEQVCSVTNGSGTLAGASITNISVSCTLAVGVFEKTTNTVSDGGTTSPFALGLDMKHQSLYLADEINATGNINSISFRLALDLATAVSCPNTTISLGHTDITSLVPVFADNIEQGQGSLQTVLSDSTVNLSAGATGDWVTIPLTTSFNYNGVDNLVVQIETTTGCDAGVSIDILLSATGNRRNLSFVTNITDGEADIAAADLIAGAYTSTAQIWTRFNFAGGDNKLDFGGVNSNFYPFHSSNLPHSQHLYLASEVNGSGPITGLAFQMGTISAAASYTATISLGHTTQPVLSENFANNFDVDGSVVAANAVEFTIPAAIPAGEWFWVPLPDSTFSYNGSDNLIVDVLVTAGSGSNNFCRVASAVGRRLLNDTDNTAATGTVDSTVLHIKPRFNGAPVQVMPIANATVAQVLGSAVTGGQLQSLYTPSIVGTGGTISSISVRLIEDSVAAAIPDYKIYMGNTSKTTFNTGDSYSSNMEVNQTLVFNGSFDIPAGLKAGDWVTIPLQTDFVYDATQNMSILFMADSASPGNNWVSGSNSAASFPNHAVGRDDNLADINQNPDWFFNGIVDVRLNITK